MLKHLVAILSVVVLAAACGSDPTSVADAGISQSPEVSASPDPAVEATTDPGVVATPTDSVTSEVESGSERADFDGHVVVNDPDGYAYDYDYSLTLGPAESSIENAKPGFTDILMYPTSTLVITNQTPGRNASGGPVTWGASFTGLFKSSRDICEFRRRGGDYTSPVYPVGFMKVAGVGEVCSINYASHARGSDQDLGEGESADVPVSPNEIDGPLTVPESQADQVMSELADPDFILLVTSYSLASEVCQFSDHDQVIAASESPFTIKYWMAFGDTDLGTKCTVAG